MNSIKKHAIYALAAVSLCCSVSTLAATAASHMHYGRSVISRPIIKSQYGAPIVITNCSEDQATVSAWFASDGSSGEWPIYPQDQYPMNVITLGDGPGAGTSPYVNIGIVDQDGTVLYPTQAVNPGAHVNIGCDQVLQAGQHPAVSISEK